MEKTLRDIVLEELNENKEFWDYYEQEFDNPFLSQATAKKFIREYFTHGSKLYAVSVWSGNENEGILIRDVHTVNVFFIGSMLQRIIDKDIAIEAKYQSEHYPFSYYWFLTCLAHDFGYVYEKNEGEHKIAEIKEKYQDYLTSICKGVITSGQCVENRGISKKINLIHRLSIYKEQNMDISRLVSDISAPQWWFDKKCCNDKEYTKRCRKMCKGNVRYNNGTVISRSRYNFVLRENYFRYRLHCMDTIDHGIIGADKLFSGLVENYIKEFHDNKMGEGEFYDFINMEKLEFSCEHFKVFTYIANTIAAHNVFMAEENRRTQYIQHKLNELLPENFKKVSYKDDPLLFVLCIADTLEPTKCFNMIDSNFVLENISVKYGLQENLLVVSISNELYKEKEGKNYLKNVSSLEKWCDIRVKVGVE